MCKKGLISDKTNDSRNAQDSVDSNKEKLTIYYECGFKWQEKISAITNRGTITSDLIKLLESNGYAVRLVFYGLLKDSCDRETLALTINMKDFDEPMNEKKLNFPLKNPSFFRRLGFRTIETTNVSKIWSDGYGRWRRDRAHASAGQRR
jgi:hypothetical protein